MSWFDIFGLLNSSGFLVGRSLLDNTTGNTILRSSACVSYHSWYRLGKDEFMFQDLILTILLSVYWQYVEIFPTEWMTLHFPVEVNLNSPDSLNRFISRSNPKHSFLEKKVFEKYWIMFDLWSWNAPLIAHKSNSTQQNNRVAKSDLNSTDAYFATKNQHQKYIISENISFPPLFK